MSYVVGLDLGQAQDYTALGIDRVESKEVEVEPWARDRVVGPDGKGPGVLVHHEILHLERMGLGTSYPLVVERVRAVICSPVLSRRVTLVVDQTGVGMAVLEMLEQAGLFPIGVTITGGDEVVKVEGRWDRLRVPKRDLVSTMQVLLQTGRMQIASSLAEAAVLRKELRDFRVRMSTAGRDQYGTWREGIHDDLVLAVALAAWYGEWAHVAAPVAKPYRLEAAWEQERPRTGVSRLSRVGSRW